MPLPWWAWQVVFSTNENRRAGGLSLGVVLGSSRAALWRRCCPAWCSLRSMPGTRIPGVYSIGYNGAYMLPECIICVVLALAVGLRLTQQLSKAK